MAENCDCGVIGLQNMGRPDCVVSFGIPRNFIAVPLYDSTGAANFIDFTGSSPFDLAYWQALTFNTDKSKRFQPLPILEDLELPIADPLQQTTTSGKTFHVVDGIRTATGMFSGKDAYPALKRQFESMRCQEVGVYIVDYKGNISGLINNGNFGELYPMPIDSESVVAQLMFPTFAPTTNQLMLNFNFTRDLNTEDIYTMPASELATDIRRLNAMIDLRATIGTVTTTSAVVDLDLNLFGNAQARTPFLGATTPADYTVFNTTDNAAVTVTGVSESATSPGKYTLTFATQDSGDVLTINYVNNRFELIQNTITIP